MCWWCSRRNFLPWAALAALVIVAPVAHSHGTRLGDLLLNHPYALPRLAGVANSAAYLRGIQNKGRQPDRLLNTSSPAHAQFKRSAAADEWPNGLDSFLQRDARTP
jgi:hypothetical protein